MSNFKIRHFERECETWSRVLDYLEEENVYLKNRVAEILKEDKENRILNEIENYQNRFVQYDTLLGLLKYNVRNQEKVLFNIKNISTETIKEQNNLRHNVEQIEKDFSELKFNFSTYLVNTLNIGV